MTLERTDPVDTDTSVMTSSFETFVHVDLAKDPEGSVRAGAGKGVDEVVTDSSILARIAEAVVDVVLAIGALESRRTGARMRSNEILTGGSVLARSRVAFVDLVLAVGSSVTFGTDASMAVTDIFAFSSMAAEFWKSRSFAECCIFTRDHLDVAQQSRPSRSASTLIGLINLLAGSSIETRSLSRLSRKELFGFVRDPSHRTPIDEALAA